LSTKNDNGRRLRLAVESKEDLTNIKLLHGRGATFMRDVPPTLAARAVSGKPIEECIKAASNVSCSIDAKFLIPAGAMPFCGVVGDGGQTSLRHARNWWHGPSSDGISDPASLYQRRLDSLVNGNWLPAVACLTSTRVVRDCPLRIDGAAVFLNSGFANDVANQTIEISRFLAGVPGLRAFAFRDESSSPVHTEGQAAKEALRGSPHESTPERIDDDERFARRERVNAEMMLKLNDEAKRLAQRVFNEGGRSGDVTIDHAEECLERVEYALPREQDRVFDEWPLYLTHKLHELFDYEDTSYYDAVVRRFPGVFASDAAVRAALPETITRFLCDLKGASPQAKVKSALPLLSTLKKCSPPDPDEQRQQPRVASATDTLTLALVHQDTLATTGENCLDLHSLHERAKNSDTAPSATVACSRSAWRKAVTIEKEARGHAGPKSMMAEALRDAGVDLLPRVRGFYAARPGVPCAEPIVAKQAKYLRPYVAPPSEGTCRALERVHMACSIKMLIDVMNGTGQWADGAFGGAQGAAATNDDDCLLAGIEED
jgi:hypothetical protein